MVKTLYSGVSQNEYKTDIANAANDRINALWNNIFGGNLRIGEPDVTEIFSRIEITEGDTEYKYNVQTGITGKSSLVRSADDIRRFSIPITLHHQFCRPDVIIRKLKEKASLEEAFSYYQQKTYMGEFVISKVSEKILNKVNGIATHAEVTVELLECPPQTPEEYEQQTKKAATNPKEVAEKPKKITKPKDILTVKPKDIWSTLSDVAVNKAIRKSESYISGSIGGIVPGTL